MRRTFLTVIPLMLFWVGLGSIRAEDAAGAILDKAIKAHGGADVLNRFKATRTTAKGTVSAADGDIDFTLEMSFMLPDKVKMLTEYTGAGRTVKYVSISDGKNVSIEAAGKALDVNETQQKNIKESCYRLRVMNLTILKDKQFELSPLGEVKIDDKPAVGIRVKCEGQKDLNLFFDKKTNLLAKMEYPATDESGKEIMYERIVKEYGKSGNLPVPKKVLLNRDGKKYFEMEITEFKYLEKLEDDEFKK